MNTAIKKMRSDIPDEYKWDIEAMYPDRSDVLRDISSAMAKAGELAGMQGHVTDSAESLLNALMLYAGSSRLIEKAYVYSHMKHDEDNSNTEFTELFGKCNTALATYYAMISFLEPEITACEPSVIYRYISDEKGLAMFSFMLKELLRRREHILPAESEQIIASYSEVLRASSDIFSALNYIDIDFGDIDVSGVSRPITHATYIGYMESSDREVRKKAFEALYSSYRSLNNTIAAIYSSNVRKDAVTAKLRNYGSSLEAALSPNSIPVSVYDGLVKAVRAHLPAMYRYLGIRKRALGLDELHMYDVYAPLTAEFDRRYTFEEAVDIACAALAPLGEDYVSVFRKGVTEDRWVDIYENTGKTSGAYSFGSYDSMPYILMNYTGTLRDVFTLIHEGGHSMHAYYTRNTQPYIYGDHSIFTAEVASTVNETLLVNYLLDNATDDNERAYIINFYIDSFKGTVFRQTMFAEFERTAHEYVEGGGALTAEWLNDTYGSLNSEYFGPEMAADDLIRYEWSRIPHFYNSFYVYQYATGFSAANAIARRILSGVPGAADDYRRFLSLGSSDTPVELLKTAGADMSTPDPVMSALDTFDELVDKLDRLVK